MAVRKTAVLLALASVFSWQLPPAQAQAPVPPPPPPPHTIWSFLGIPQACKHLHGAVANRHGKHPKCEKKPPVLALADPANLKSENPAIKKAAEIKKEEDLKKQKIKAIRYLTSIGCGCYNRDGSITDALIKAMDDCTEDVRLATVEAIAEAAGGEMCENCKLQSCCSEEISNKLYEIAYERDETGCFLEPSERVRLAAAEALRICCPGTDEEPTLAPYDDGGPRIFEGPGTGPRPEAPNPAIPPEPAGEEAASLIPPPPAAIPLAPPPVIVEAPAEPASAVEPQEEAEAPQEPVAVQSSRRSAATRGVARPASTTKKPAARSQRATSLLPPPPAAAPAAAEKAAEDPVATAPARQSASAPAVAKEEILMRLPVADEASSSEPEQVVETNLAPIVSADEVTTSPSALDLFGHPRAKNQLPPVVSRSAKGSSRRSGTARPAARVIPASSTEDAVSPSVLNPRESGEPSDSALPAPPLPLTGITGRRLAPRAPRDLPGAEFGTAIVRSIHPSQTQVMLVLDAAQAVPPGSVLRAYHSYALGTRKAVCDLEVVSSEPGLAIAQPRSGSSLQRLAVGDEAIVLR